MHEKRLIELLERAEELKVVVFLEEVIDFVREIKPLLDSMNNTIADNIMRMPSASKKLAKVTEATEVATQEIMNTLDSIFDKTANISNNLNKLSQSEENSQTIIESKTLLDDIQNDANSIMMALQVQDITSQQIAAVNNVLDVVRTRLSSILGQFEVSILRELLRDEKSDGTIQSSQLHREIAFDPNAVDAIARKAERQGDVDKLIEQFESGNEIDTNENIDNDDIDSLLEAFNQNSSQEKLPAFAENSISENSAEEFSQDDIDALFGK